MAKRNRGIEKSHSILFDLFYRKGWEKKLGLHQVFLFWDKVVGKEIALHAQPEIIRDKTLWLRVSDNVWMQQLHLQKTLILDKVNAKLPDEKLMDIRFQIDPRLGREVKQEIVPERKTKIDAPVPPELGKMIDLLPEKEMQDSLKRLWKKVKGER